MPELPAQPSVHVAPPRCLGHPRMSATVAEPGLKEAQPAFSAASGTREKMAGRRRGTRPTVRVLVVEDEKRLAAGLKKGLEAEGFATDVALDGTDGLWMAREHPYDAIVLDIMLPGMNGYQVCATLREEGIWTPILMLTAKDGEFDEAEALDTGADDYLTKPFSYVVLVARLRALMRRGAGERPAVLEAGDLRFDPGAAPRLEGRRRARPDAREMASARVPPAAQGRGRVEADILDHVWDYDFEGDPNIVEVYVAAPAQQARPPLRAQRDRDRAGRRLPTGGRRWVSVRACGRPRSRSSSWAWPCVIGSVLMVSLLRRSLRDDVRTAALVRAATVADFLRSSPPGEPIPIGDQEEEFVQVLDARRASGGVERRTCPGRPSGRSIGARRGRGGSIRGRSTRATVPGRGDLGDRLERSRDGDRRDEPRRPSPRRPSPRPASSPGGSRSSCSWSASSPGSSSDAPSRPSKRSGARSRRSRAASCIAGCRTAPGRTRSRASRGR